MGSDPLIVPCDSCGRALSLPEGGHRPEAVTCPECGARVRLSSGLASWEDAEPDPVPSDPDWFVLLQGKQLGPLDGQALVDRVRTGEVHGRTFVWRDGFDGWRRALEVPELLPVLEQAGFPSTPPHGPLTPADGLSPPRGRTPPARQTPPSGRTPSRAATPSELSARRPGAAPQAPVEEELELELSRVRPRRTPRPESDDVVRTDLRRQSPWKLAILLSAVLVLPVGGLALLVSMRRPPVVVEAHGEAPSEAAPTGGPPPKLPRVQQLRELLLGKPAEPAPAPPLKHQAAPEAKAPPPKPAPDGPKTAELRALYGDARKPDVGPRVRRSESPSGAQGGGPSNEEVARVVGQTQSAFQSCIEQQLRKNPGFHGGKVSLVATVGSSGTVKQVQLDRRDLEGTDLGGCLKARARRMVFSSFSGGDVDVEIPLVLTTSL